MKPVVFLCLLLISMPTLALAQTSDLISDCLYLRGMTFSTTLSQVTAKELRQMEARCDRRFAGVEGYEGGEILITRSHKKYEIGNVTICVAEVLNGADPADVPECQRQYSASWRIFCCPTPDSEFEEIGDPLEG